MSGLKDYSSEELKVELERRKNVYVDRPEVVRDINWDPLIAIANESIDSIIDNDGYPGKDIEQYIFETTMECIFGEDVFKWWNDNVKH